MEFVHIRPKTKYYLRAYEPGCVQINDDFFYKSLIVLPDQLILDWPVNNINDLTTHECQAFLRFDCDILLIGTGPQLIFPDRITKGWLANQKFGVECMDTGAACRSFHIL